MSTATLEVVHLSKRYGDTIALDRVTLGIAEGEIFGLLGPNGAGKTTLLSLVSGLLEPDGGEVRLLGRRFSSERDLRRAVGIVPQELAIYGELTARENLVFFGELYGLGGDDLRRRADEVLEAVGLTERADDRAETFSGGMKRRLNLGVGLVHRPRLLLLDEPTTGVDPQSRNHIFEGVRRLNAEGMTVVYTSHYIEEVQALCSRVGIIDRGRLIACDTLENLLQRLDGLVRFRVTEVTPALRGALEALPGARVSVSGGAVELRSRDVKAALVSVVGLLSEADVRLLSLESHEPNLERVFLDLTGRALRD